jgi:DNA-directed RNA polymerase specialized sigma24 family protein
MAGLSQNSDEHNFDLEHFAEQWKRQLSTWIRIEVTLNRLPPHIGEDLLQQTLLQAIESAKSSGRAAIIRISKDHLRRAIAEERRFYRRASSFDGTREHRLFAESDRPDWSGPADDRAGWVERACERFRRELTARERKLLELRYVVPAPGRDRPYPIKEIADLWGLDYAYLRRLVSKTVAKARRIAVEARDDGTEPPDRPVGKRPRP